MTIAETDREVKDLVEKHHVYGAETIINALVRACDKKPYLGRAELIKLIDNAYEHLNN